MSYSDKVFSCNSHSKSSTCIHSLKWKILSLNYSRFDTPTFFLKLVIFSLFDTLHACVK